MLLMPWLVALTALACSPARDGEEAAFARAREDMVANQIAARGVRDPKTLDAMRKVARHLFVSAAAVTRPTDYRCRSATARRSRSRTSSAS
jgi:hypothetical protein